MCSPSLQAVLLSPIFSEGWASQPPGNLAHLGKTGQGTYGHRETETETERCGAMDYFRYWGERGGFDGRDREEVRQRGREPGRYSEEQFRDPGPPGSLSESLPFTGPRD